MLLTPSTVSSVPDMLEGANRSWAWSACKEMPVTPVPIPGLAETNAIWRRGSTGESLAIHTTTADSVPRIDEFRSVQ